MAGGSGSRFGRLKQFDLLAGRPVASWAVSAARSVAGGVVLVVPANDAPEDREVGGESGRRSEHAEPGEAFGADLVVEGGDTRSASVRHGLAAVPESAEIVVVHDAARPLAPPALFHAVVEPLLGSAPASLDGPHLAGVICGLRVSDTVKRLAPDGTTVAATLERGDLVTVQTPQAFRAAALRRAHAGGGEATDDAGLVEAAGGVVVVVEGDRRNVKVTVPEDLALAERLLAVDGGASRAAESPVRAPGGARRDLVG